MSSADTSPTALSVERTIAADDHVCTTHCESSSGHYRVTPQGAECPGQFVGWSAFGARYPDTVCSTSLTWAAGTAPSSPTLCDADDDHRPRDIPCPACDPAGFDEYAGAGAHLAVYRLCGLTRAAATSS